MPAADRRHGGGVRDRRRLARRRRPAAGQVPRLDTRREHIPAARYVSYTCFETIETNAAQNTGVK